MESGEKEEEGGNLFLFSGRGGAKIRQDSSSYSSSSGGRSLAKSFPFATPCCRLL